MVRLTLFVVGLALLPLNSAHAAGNGTLGEAVDSIAADIKKILEGVKDNRIRLASIVPLKVVDIGNGKRAPALTRFSSAQSTFENEFRRALSAKQIQIDPKANHRLEVTFNEAEGKLRAEDTSDSQYIEITWKIIDDKGTEVFSSESRAPNLDQSVWHERSAATIAGVNFEIPPTDSNEQRKAKMKDAFDAPKVALSGNKIKAKADSPFAIAVLTAPVNGHKTGDRKFEDYAAQKPQDDQGLAFVPIKRDEVYAVQLFNDSGFEAAVDLRIDGLSMYTFSDKQFRDKNDQPIYHYVIVPAGKSVLIRGWHVTNDDSDEFLVTSYVKSAAAQFSSSANIGTITASFHASWDKKTGKPPADEPSKPTQSATPADATGRGKRFAEEYKPVDYDIGVPRAAISVRYTK